MIPGKKKKRIRKKKKFLPSKSKDEDKNQIINTKKWAHSHIAERNIKWYTFLGEQLSNAY